MPWNRLRAGQFDSLRRHSTLNLDQPDPHHQEHYENEMKAREPASLRPDAAFNSVSDLMNDDHELHTSQSQGQSPSPYTQEPQPRPQRFSLLKFRHASDPQLARTARDQAMSDRPPMPAGELCHDFSLISQVPLTDSGLSSIHHNHSSRNRGYRYTPQEAIRLALSATPEAAGCPSFALLQTIQTFAHGEKHRGW